MRIALACIAVAGLAGVTGMMGCSRDGERAPAPAPEAATMPAPATIDAAPPVALATVELRVLGMT